jgi:glucose-6-phosphate 1-dehydrogenase
MQSDAPVILVIVGVTGDLARRKLLPAIEAMAREGTLPKRFAVVGTTRQRDIVHDHLLIHLEEPHIVKGLLELFPMDVEDARDYSRLSTRLEEIEHTFGQKAERLWYLSVPPHAAWRVIEQLGESALSRVPDTKLLMEKPFGVDLTSATELMAHIERYFSPEQVYAIDHYLAKGVAQDIIVANSREPLSVGRGITKIEIAASESIGIEGRAKFYEQTGALRDVLQNHLLALAALTLMDDEKVSAPMRRLAALQKLRLSDDVPAHRGQYIGYREEVGNPESVVETYVDVTLESEDPRFKNVPIRLATGKGLENKETSIRVTYREGATEERVVYTDTPSRATEAYEKILLAAIGGDRDLFVASEEIVESWRIIAPVQDAWQDTSDDLFLYEKGRSISKLLE